MNPRRRLFGWRAASTAGLAAIALVVVAGCNNAELVDVWKDPSFRATPMQSVLIASQRQDPVARRLWEDSVAEQLEKHGVDAVASHELFPDTPPTQAQM